MIIGSSQKWSIEKYTQYRFWISHSKRGSNSTIYLSYTSNVVCGYLLLANALEQKYGFCVQKIRLLRLSKRIFTVDFTRLLQTNHVIHNECPFLRKVIFKTLVPSLLAVNTSCNIMNSYTEEIITKYFSMIIRNHFIHWTSKDW